MKSKMGCSISENRHSTLLAWHTFAMLAIVFLLLSGCAATSTISGPARKPIRVFVVTFEDAPDAPGSGKLFTSAFTTALQTVSSKVKVRYILLTKKVGADATISGRVTVWKKGSWTEMATVGFTAECVSTETSEILWSVSEVGRPFRMALEQRTPEYCAEAVALDGIHKIRKWL